MHQELAQIKVERSMLSGHITYPAKRTEVADGQPCELARLRKYVNVTQQLSAFKVKCTVINVKRSWWINAVDKFLILPAIWNTRASFRV